MEMQELQAKLDEGIAAKMTPCAVLSAWHLHGASFRMTAGCHTYESDRKVKEDDLFDLASITKCVGTTTLCMWLYDQGKLDLHAPLYEYLPEFLDGPQEQLAWRKAVTIRHVMAHCAGFPPFLKFYVTHAHVTDWIARRKLVLSTALTYEPGKDTVYSDIGFMIMGEVVRAISGKRVDELAPEVFFKKWGMKDTTYNPDKSLWPRCVPTELKKDKDGDGYWQGVVHDENARWYEGAAGHAGLFSTAPDLDLYAMNMLTGGGGVFSQQTIDVFTTRANIVEGSSRCLGWDSPEQPSSGGLHVSPCSFGHTGFTGTSFWMDPEKGVSVALLTNAVHPKRECKGNGYFPWRNRMHTYAYEVLGVI
ncbi:MAG: serine hydrolase [Victivallales bacterium]|nr:serine hydrolase [Victivallales bacterium]